LVFFRVTVHDIRQIGSETRGEFRRWANLISNYSAESLGDFRYVVGPVNGYFFADRFIEIIAAIAISSGGTGFALEMKRVGSPFSFGGERLMVGVMRQN
jgi:hypothetical protein